MLRSPTIGGDSAALPIDEGVPGHAPAEKRTATRETSPVSAKRASEREKADEAAAAQSVPPTPSPSAAPPLPGVPLTLLEHEPLAVCLDGTPGGYYHSPPGKAPTAKPRSWVIFLDGDGECSEKEKCTALSKTAAGSSKLFAPALAEMPLMLSRDCGAFPAFCVWHHVVIPYCSQDLFTGRVFRPSKKTWGLRFAGHGILAGVVDELKRTAGLGEATEVLVVGAGDGGGMGVWAAVDFIGSRIGGSVKVSGLSVAGFYDCDAAPYAGPGHLGTLAADFRCPAWEQRYALWGSYVDEDCASALKATPWLCLLAATAAPFVSSRVFVAQALLDAAVLEAHYGVPATATAAAAAAAGTKAALLGQHPAPERQYMAEWRAGLEAALGALMASPQAVHAGRGVFAPACTHSGLTGGVRVRGKGFFAAFARWFFAATGGKPPKPPGYALIDPCVGLACNPTCAVAAAASG